MGTLIPACEKCAGLVHGKGGDKGAGRSEVPVSASQAVRGIEMSAEDRESLRAKEGMDGSNDWAEDAEIRVLATKAMRSLVDSKDALSGQARGMIKSPSFEMLENYRKQPLHVRSRAEQWELLPSVSNTDFSFG